MKPWRRPSKLTEVATVPDRAQKTAQVLATILALNLLVAVAKALYGGLSGSLAVSSDALHSLLDGISNVVGLVAIGYARRPPDANHPYGYAKAEVIASVAIGVVIAVGALEFGVSAADRLLRQPEMPQVTAVGVGVLLATLAVNLFVSMYEARAARRLRSPILAADAAHTGVDVLVTVVVLASQGAVYWGWGWADPVASLIVLAAILRVAMHIVRDNTETLLDRAALDPHEVRSVVLSVSRVQGCHRIRSRGPEDAIQLDLHLTADRDMTLGAAHALSHQVEEKLRDSYRGLCDVTIHIEPHDDAEEPL